MKNLELEKLQLVEIEPNQIDDLNGGSLRGVAGELFFRAVSAVQDLGNGMVQGYKEGRLMRVINESQKLA